MNELSTNTYKFGNFFFDADKLALYYQNQLIRNLGEKSLQVLAVLLKNANELASHEEIIEQVWEDNSSGITSLNIAQNIAKLRKVLKEYDPDKNFIDNVKGRGYTLVAEVKSGILETSRDLPFLQSEAALVSNETNNSLHAKDRSTFGFVKPAFFFAALFSISVIFFVMVWNWNSKNDDDAEIRRVVEDSQKFESLVLYQKPSAFEESQLAKYWMPETEFSSDFDIKKIRSAVQNLVKEGRYYGRETKLERFEFQYVEINKENDFAVVKTLEKWFIVEYQNDGTLLKTKPVGPYFVSYILQKVEGRWLIEKSNTARANPVPED